MPRERHVNQNAKLGDNGTETLVMPCERHVNQNMIWVLDKLNIFVIPHNGRVN